MQELTKALCAARNEISGVIFKGGQNKHQGYGYVGHEHVIRHGVREALAKHGLSLLMLSIELAEQSVPAGKISVHLWRGVFRLLHVSGEHLDLTMLATIQPNDKAAFVASTSLERVALQRVLQLTGSADEDVEHYENTDSPTFHAPPPPPQNGAPAKLDQHVQGLVARLQKATPTTLDELVAEARGVYRSVYPHERQAISDAIEFAKAAIAQEQERAATQAALAGQTAPQAGGAA